MTRGTPPGTDVVLADAGPAAPPRSNGELVFEAPWESRAFGMAVALCEGRVYDWDEFRTRLIAAIGAWERSHTADPTARWSYYDRWLESLEQVLLDRGLVTEQELLDRTALVAEEAEHEHDDEGHDDDHHHHHHHHHHD